MRVLHVTSGNLWGGIETMLVTMARWRHLRPELEPQFAVCFEGRLAGELRASGAPVHSVGPVRARNPLSVRRARRDLVALVEAERIDLVICHAAWSQALFGPAARTAGRPLVVWQHAPPRTDYWLDRWARRTQPDHFICNSRYTATSLERWLGGPSTEVVYCPVASPNLSDRFETRRRVREVLGVSDGTRVVVQVSRLEPSKGHLLLLEALHRLEGVGEWQCWIVGGAQQPGEQSYRARLEETVRRFGLEERVRFLGQRTDVEHVLAAADVACQPNVEPEPFGIAVIEALFAGLPVVATRMGGPSEIVNDACGLLVERDRPQELADALSALLADAAMRTRLGDHGPERARDLCDPAARLTQLQSALERTLSAQKSEGALR